MDRPTPCGTTMRRATPKRVLVAVGNYPPGYGGAGLRVHRTYQRLGRHLPLTVQAATVSGRGDMENCTEFEGVPIFQTGAKVGFLAQFLALRPLFLQRGPQPFDLVHALGQSGIATAAAAWALLLRIPVVRELTVNQPIRRSLHPVAILRRLTFRRGRLVVALNAGLRQRLIEAGVDGQRIWERPNPVDTDVFFPADRAARHLARQHYALAGDGPVHLLLGRTCARKNQLFALEVLARLPWHHRLLLLGPCLVGDQDYVKEINRRILEPGLRGRVIFQARHVENARLAYHAADCCWIPSTSEGMPNVLLEALVCGLPVVVNQALDLQEHIAEGINGFACALDPTAFAECAQAAAERLTADACTAKIAATATQRYAAQRIDAEFARRLSNILDLAPEAQETAGATGESGRK